MKKYFYLLIGFTVLGLTVACNKDNEELFNETEVDVRSSRLKDNNDVTSQDLLQKLDIPEISDDVLHFRDFEHFSSYYITLDNLFTLDQQAYNNYLDGNDDDENGIRFQSDGTNYLSVHAKFRDQTFSSPEEMYKPFITDPIMMGIVNEYFEFRVGDELVTQINNTHIVSCSVQAITDRSAIRELDKGEPFDAGVLPENVRWSCDTDTELLLRSAPPCDCTFEVDRTNCETWRVNVRCEDSNGDPVEAKFTGSSLSALSLPRTINGNGSFMINKQILIASGIPRHSHHPALANGNAPFASVDLFYENEECNTNTIGEPKDEHKKTATISLRIHSSCDSREKDTGYLWKDDGANQGFTYRTKVYSNWLGRHYESAEMWSKYKDSQGNWHYNNELFIKAHLTAQRLNTRCTWLGIETNNVSIVERASEECHCHYRRARLRADSATDPETGQEVPAYCDKGVVGRYEKSHTWQGQLYEIKKTDDSLLFECCPIF